jgi:hypothetical protein
VVPTARSFPEGAGLAVTTLISGLSRRLALLGALEILLTYI